MAVSGANCVGFGYRAVLGFGSGGYLARSLHCRAVRTVGGFEGKPEKPLRQGLSDNLTGHYHAIRYPR